MSNIPATNIPIVDAGRLTTPDWYKYFQQTWQTYTPVVTSGTGTLTSAAASGRFTKTGKMVLVNIALVITTNGTGATSLNVTLPFIVGTGCGFMGNALTGHVALSGQSDPGSNGVAIYKYDGTYPGSNGQIIKLMGLYEASS